MIPLITRGQSLRPLLSSAPSHRTDGKGQEVLKEMAFPPHPPHPGGLPQLILDSWAFLVPEVGARAATNLWGAVGSLEERVGIWVSCCLGFASNSATWAKCLQVFEYSIYQVRCQEHCMKFPHLILMRTHMTVP